MEKTWGVFFLIICGVLTLTTGGCSASRINIVKTKSVALEVVPSNSFDLKKVAVYQEDNNVIVKGQVWLTRHFMPGDYGHIDIEVLDKQNTVTEKHSVFHRPRTLRIGGRSPAYFKTFLSSVPQQGNRVRIRYHQPDNTIVKAFCIQ